jgi:hypothetical protein
MINTAPKATAYFKGLFLNSLSYSNYNWKFCIETGN